MLEKVLSLVPREEIFAQTGIQFMQINTLIQLYAMKAAGDPALASARTLLMMPICSITGLPASRAAS